MSEPKHTPGGIGTRERDEAKAAIGSHALATLEELNLCVVTEEQAQLAGSAPALLEALEGLLGDIEELISESGGVYGLHLNGDPAPWSTLQEGGDFAEWLENLPKARAAIAKARGEA